MNIFALDPCPYNSARQLCDKHVVKMALETAQILCTVRSKWGDETPYRPTHAKHPCVIWASQTFDNYLWLTVHGIEICKEYTRRYGRTHASEEVIKQCQDRLHTITPEQLPDTNQLTPFPLAMPDEYKVDCPHQSYRNYYKYGKAHILSYTNRLQPNWL